MLEQSQKNQISFYSWNYEIFSIYAFFSYLERRTRVSGDTFNKIQDK